MKAVSIAGWSGSGKTTLISTLIKEFKSKGKKVIALKNVKHKYDLEPESKDTFKFLDAGADEVLMIAKNEFITMTRVTETTDIIAILESKYAAYDILLLEGLNADHFPLIEVFDSEKHDALKFPIDRLNAVISDKPVTDAIPNFNRNDIDSIIRFLEKL